MSKFERILSYGLFSNGTEIGDWSPSEILDKIMHPWKQFTEAEKHILDFMEKAGDFMGPRETWVRPYGKVLNETRKLH